MLSTVADILSIAGFFISVITLYFTWRIRQKIANRIRTPEVKISLERHAKSLQNELSTWPDSKQGARTTVERIRSVLQNAQDKVPPREKKKIGALLGRIKRQSSWLYGFYCKITETSISEETNLWEIHASVMGVIEALEQNKKDNIWK